MAHWYIQNVKIMNKQLRASLLEICIERLNVRLSTIQKIISELQNALQSETKSTAGDKHETGRAMVQLEREKAGQQLAQIQAQFQILQKIKRANTGLVIGLGSVVLTDRFNYYIAISAGEISSGGKTFFAISPQTPIAKLLLGKTVGEVVVFRSDRFEILGVL